MLQSKIDSTYLKFAEKTREPYPIHVVMLLIWSEMNCPGKIKQGILQLQRKKLLLHDILIYNSCNLTLCVQWVSFHGHPLKG